MVRLLCLFVLVLVTACGKTTGANDIPAQQKFILNSSGYYRAPFLSLNTKKGRAIGRASFFINKQQFYAKVNLHTPWRKVQHLQMVHEKSVCPTMKDDLNRDGLLDATESLAVTGNVIVPLDSDLRTQAGQFNVIPESGERGKYLYSQSVSTRSLMQELWSVDRDPLDFISKLPRGEELDLPKRVVVIYGVPPAMRLSASVASFGGFPAYLSLPIACAVINETSEVFP